MGYLGSGRLGIGKGAGRKLHVSPDAKRFGQGPLALRAEASVAVVLKRLAWQEVLQKLHLIPAQIGRHLPIAC